MKWPCARQVCDNEHAACVPERLSQMHRGFLKRTISGYPAGALGLLKEGPSERCVRKNKDLRKQFFSEEKNQKTFVF